MSTDTLKSVLDGAKLTDEERERINRLLLLNLQLSDLQLNICGDIERTLEKSSQYKFGIKHWNEQVKALIRKNVPRKAFFRKLDNKQQAAFGDDGESLEKIVYGWAGLEKA